MISEMRTKLAFLIAIAGLVMSFSAAYGQGAESPPGGLADAGTHQVDVPDWNPPAGVVVADAGIVATDDGTEADIEKAEIDNPAESDTLGTAGKIHGALKAGSWLIAFGGILMFLVWAIRLGLAYFWDFWGTKKGGVWLAFGTTAILTVSTSLFAGEGLSIEIFFAAFTAAAAAAGKWGWAKDMFAKPEPVLIGEKK